MRCAVLYLVLLATSLADLEQETHPFLKIDSIYDECPSLNFEWPSIDMVLPIIDRDLGFLPPLFRSLETFWPWHQIPTSLILLFDKGHEWLAEDVLPAWLKPRTRVFSFDTHVLFNFTNRNIMKDGASSHAKQLQMLFADKYTTADYIAFLDCDMILTTLVTPDLLFDPQGRLIILGGTIAVPEWRNTIQFLFQLTLEQAKEVPYFMAQLPWIVPRWVLPSTREHIQQLHQASDFETLYLKNFAQEGTNGEKEVVMLMCDFCVMGAFMWFHHRDQFHWYLQGSRGKMQTFPFPNQPILRIGEHIGYAGGWATTVMTDGQKIVQKPDPKYNHKLSIQTLREAFWRIHMGRCFLLPPELRHESCAQYQDLAHYLLFNWQNFGLAAWVWLEGTSPSIDAVACPALPPAPTERRSEDLDPSACPASEQEKTDFGLDQPDRSQVVKVNPEPKVKQENLPQSNPIDIMNLHGRPIPKAKDRSRFRPESPPHQEQLPKVERPRIKVQFPTEKEKDPVQARNPEQIKKPQPPKQQVNKENPKKTLTHKIPIELVDEILSVLDRHFDPLYQCACAKYEAENKELKCTSFPLSQEARCKRRQAVWQDLSSSDYWLMRTS